MTQDASQFVGDIPANYDAGLGPVIFTDYAADIARRTAALKPTRVLELAAGTGIVSRKLRDTLAPEAELTVTDLNAPMLEVARAKFRDGENVTFTPADAMSLAFPDAHFDAIVCQFGVMFFPDKQASFREALRVLKPDGAYLFSAWGTMAENAYAQIATDVCAHFFPDNPPGFYRVPFSYADVARVITDLRAAGFANVTHDIVAIEKPIPDIAAFARGLVHGNPLIAEIKNRGGVDAAEVMQAIEIRLRDAWSNAPMPLKAHVFLCRCA